MTQSMTAFARVDGDTPWGVMTWELRSVNHRYLELTPRLPEGLRDLEPLARELAGQRLGRGKVEINLRFQPQEQQTGEFELVEAVVERLAQAADRIVARDGRIAPLRSIDILRWPGAIKAPDVDYQALAKSGMALLGEALEALIAMRRREGQRLAEFIIQRLTRIQEVVAEVRGFLPEIVANYRARLNDRLAELKGQLDPERLEQEIVLFAHKVDVAEELDRLGAHLDEIRQTLSQGQPVGRRLDFLIQELNREANTLGSKAADIRLTNAAVEMKVQIEQMREQVQNIE